MKSVSIAVAVVSLSVAPACAFSFRPARTITADTTPQTQEVDAFNLDKHAIQDTTQGLMSTTTDTSSVSSGNTIRQSLLAGCMTFLTTSPLAALAAADDLELEELPPVYVPIIFAIFVLGGVGVLTASLGNVMDEEASLGLQSGARAKKERDRSRSSYFKK
ncbi:hypothetical protein THAOC_06624 [Thalassiosira oceanica]|uniref:Dolichol phosphate-mannose biosynthesis regulatory protein n=1 Tax=Thalassiosira oceanica TaxID=159749 RepID=K0T280_THAOC|nr:hypothetical protein THAOC_06624 [Thalassiosira oceanica]|eukprot:EJK71890.1 hypothetical protein THAOC_06624 [Thalassiosira oceanica]